MKNSILVPEAGTFEKQKLKKEGIMYEVVERSMNTGGVSMTYSGYETEADAEEVAADMAEENPGFWYEVREQRG